MRARYWLAIAIVTVSPTTLRAQDSQPEAGRPASAGAQAHAQAQARTPKARIDAAMRAAANANVPLSLLESKVSEGEAKQVPPERIAAALEARAQLLIQAAQTLEEANLAAQSAGELSIAADALQAGVTKSVLIKTYRSAPDDRRIVAVAVVADLVRLGAVPEQAFARVSSALTSNIALANLQAEVASQLRLGGLGTTLDASGILKLK